MIKTYCDVCGEEGAPDSGDRLSFKFGRVTVLITVAIDNRWNAGHICNDCIIETINKGKQIAEDKFTNRIKE